MSTPELLGSHLSIITSRAVRKKNHCSKHSPSWFEVKHLPTITSDHLTTRDPNFNKKKQQMSREISWDLVLFWTVSPPQKKNESKLSSPTSYQTATWFLANHWWREVLLPSWLCWPKAHSHAVNEVTKDDTQQWLGDAIANATWDFFVWKNRWFLFTQKKLKKYGLVMIKKMWKRCIKKLPNSITLSKTWSTGVHKIFVKGLSLTCSRK